MAENARIKPVERATNRTWDEWLAFMDRIGAEHLDHKAIALQVYEEIGPTLDQRGWWTQAVTVAYEQHIGRRIPGQRPDGTFQTSVSRSTSLGMRELVDRWESFAAGDEEVLAIVGEAPRVSGTERRISWRAKARDGSAVVVIGEPKKNGTASLVVQHMGLATPELNEAARERWAAIVGRFLGSV
ncbi:hypothetical protein [Blastococcus litoris]|uniref:hypothetical protein n=1 Tax=Blastococcus litoris TaxID=2171622 RepID=UPI000E308E38|nr:hypothetical protein [Blastococcus litoris]